MIIFGIDASTKSTGFSVFNDGTLIDYGVIRPSGEMNERICLIVKRFKELFNKYSPEIVYIEDVPLSGSINKRVAENLLLLQGCIMGLCFENKTKFVQLEPSNWRRLVGLNSAKRREEQKESAINLVNKTYSFNYEWIDKKQDEKTGDSDVCEAILIGIAGNRKDVIE